MTNETVLLIDWILGFCQQHETDSDHESGAVTHYCKEKQQGNQNTANFYCYRHIVGGTL